jgi:hypothetical protein
VQVDKLSALGEGDSKGAAAVLADMRALASDEMVLRDLETVRAHMGAHEDLEFHVGVGVGD